MKLLVTGATGFIGSNLVPRLLKAGHSVHIIVRTTDELTGWYADRPVPFHIDTGTADVLRTICAAEKFDGIVHLASCFLVQHTSAQIQDLIDSNVLFGTRLLEAAAGAGIPWFLNTGTYWQHFGNNAYSPVNLYSATKQAFEDIARFYGETGAIRFASILLNDTYGPNDTRPKVFNLWLKALRTGETLQMSPGDQLMDIVYIDDIVAGFEQMVRLLANKDPRIENNGQYAVKARERMTLKEMAGVFEQATGKKLNVVWGAQPYRKRQVMVPWTNGTVVPDWRPQVSLTDGIRKIMEEQGAS